MGIINVTNLWPARTIPYEILRIGIDQENYDLMVNSIKKAIEHWNTMTVLDIVPIEEYKKLTGKTKISKKIVFEYNVFETRNSSARSLTDNINDIQYIWYGIDVVQWWNDVVTFRDNNEKDKAREAYNKVLRIMTHEIGHAIRLKHEHQRPNRDDFVTVSKKAINENKGNYEKLDSPNNRVMYQTLPPYDCNSIMHYSERVGYLSDVGLCPNTGLGPVYEKKVIPGFSHKFKTWISTLDAETINFWYKERPTLVF